MDTAAKLTVLERSLFFKDLEAGVTRAAAEGATARTLETDRPCSNKAIRQTITFLSPGGGCVWIKQRQTEKTLCFAIWDLAILSARSLFFAACLIRRLRSQWNRRAFWSGAQCA